MSEQNVAIATHRLPKVAAALCLAAAAYYLGAVLYVTLSRISYPFALEWLEGTSLVHVNRILAGKLLYVEPSISYVPLSYPPLYYYLSAIVSVAAGGGFLPLRIVSLATSLGSIALIYAVVRREGGSAFAGLISAGLFCAAFRIGGAWFDIARVDMLGVFFMLAALRLMLSSSRSGMALGGVCIALACLTKQPYMIALAVMCAYLLISRRDRHAVLFLIASLGVYVAATLVLDRFHGGWYRFFVFEMPSRHDLLRELEYGSRVFWIDTVARKLPIVSALALWFLFGVFRPQRNKVDQSGGAPSGGALVALTGAAIALSWSGLTNPGGYNNVLVPALALFAIIAGLGLDRIRSSVTRPHASVAASVLVAVQFGLLYFPLGAQIPTAEDRRAGTALVNRLRSQTGDVFVPYHPELPLLAGKPSYANYIALYELEGGQGGGDEQLWRRVRSALTVALARHKFSLILLDKPQFWGSPDRYYIRSEIAIGEGVFYPVTGWRIRPDVAYSLSQ